MLSPLQLSPVLIWYFSPGNTLNFFPNLSQSLLAQRGIHEGKVRSNQITPCSSLRQGGQTGTPDVIKLVTQLMNYGAYHNSRAAGKSNVGNKVARTIFAIQKCSRYTKPTYKGNEDNGPLQFVIKNKKKKKSPT